MMNILKRLLRQHRKKKNHIPQSKIEDHSDESDLGEDAWPTFPPPPPREIMSDRLSYTGSISARKFGAPKGQFEDQPLYALYRLYEHILLDNNLGMRNELEAFWSKPWPVHEIPDPKDETCPEQYAVLACIPALIAEAFNRRLDLGLRREGHGIMMSEEREALAQTPKVYEKAPAWAEDVTPLDETLHITHIIPGEEQLSSLDDERASPPFREKNILIWHPHIHFI